MAPQLPPVGSVPFWLVLSFAVALGSILMVTDRAQQRQGKAAAGQRWVEGGGERGSRGAVVWRRADLAR